MKQESFQCQLIKLKKMPLECNHKGILIVFVLSGSCDVKRFNQLSQFKEGNAFFVNQNQVYQLSSKQGCIVEIIKISCDLIEKYGKGVYRNLELIDSVGGLDQEKEIEGVYRDCVFLKDLLQGYVYNKKEASFQELEMLQEKIISTLISEYNSLNYKDHLFRYVNEDSVERYYRIMDYIQNHLKEKLTLQSAAETEHMQKSYFATLWKQMNSQTFLECVNQLRLMKAEELLLFTDYSHSRIIEECGFSDSKYFYKYFMEAFNETPKQYKDIWNHANEQIDYVELDRQEAERVLEEMSEQLDTVNTETHFLAQYRMLKGLEYQGVELNEFELEIDLFHKDDILIVQQSKVNTWYGFDLIMNIVRTYGIQTLMRIDYNQMGDQSDEEELLKMVGRSKVRFGNKVIRNWRFNLLVHDENHLERASQLQKKISKLIPGVKCGIQLS